MSALKVDKVKARVVTPSVDNIEGPRPTVPMREFKNSLEKKIGKESGWRFLR